MPGILPRSEGTPKNSFTTKAINDPQAEVAAVNGALEAPGTHNAGVTKLTNGDYSHANGALANGHSASLSESSGATGMGPGQLPPEIEHITFGYQPFSSLISRLVQETFNGILDLISDTSEIPIQSSQSQPVNQQNMVNGNSSGGNVQKKLRILNFASDRRAQFIKILVLLGWTRQAEAVSKAIDLNVWTSNRLKESNDCISWIGELKRMLVPLRDPNPDIKTALEVLSLRKASWLSDLSYIPPEPLSPQQLLSTLRKINTLLSIRLNLHEKIPRSLRQFSIASGRATFHVSNEFEVDLSIAEEDPSSQLYFIDFRFAFSPTPAKLPAGRLRDEVERKANDILKKIGLQGLFDFLHDLTLTHKLNVLRSQAHQMGRGYWSEQLKVETVHRSVVVQYWCNRPGGKNWIEIGIKRGRSAITPYSLKTQPIPCMSLRWFRDGKQVHDAEITMNMANLSLEATLKQVIALHTTHIFEQMAVELRKSLLYSTGTLRLKQISSETEPLDASLLVQLTTAKAIKLVQEPVSGRFSVLPASKLNSRAEYHLNRLLSPAREGASQLTYLRSFASHEEAETGVGRIGWEPVQDYNPHPGLIETKFTKGIQKIKLFKKATWSSGWMLAFTTSLEGDLWWIVELSDQDTANPQSLLKSSTRLNIRAAFNVLLGDLLMVDSSCTALMNIERKAAGMVSQYVDTRALAVNKLPHKIRTPRRKTQGNQLGSLVVRFAGKKLVRATSRAGLHWLSEIVKVDYSGLDQSRCNVVHSVRILMQRSTSEIQSLISNVRGILFQPASGKSRGSIIFQCRTKVGETVLYILENRLKAISLVLDFASITMSYQLECKVISLATLDFKYTRAAKPLEASIHFPENAPQRISFGKSNPHLRVVDFLSERLRSQGLSPLVGVLRMTLYLLQAFSAIESSPDSAGVDILARSDLWYQVRYSEPFMKGSFDIRLRQRRDDPLWFIPESSIQRVDGGNEALEEFLKVAMRGRGEGWWGVKGGLIAQMKGVENLIAKLDAVFRTSKRIAGESNPKKRKAEGEVVEID